MGIGTDSREAAAEVFTNLQESIDLYRQRHGINGTPPLIAEDWDVILAALPIAAAVMRPGVIEENCLGGDLGCDIYYEAAAIRAALVKGAG